MTTKEILRTIVTCLLESDARGKHEDALREIMEQLETEDGTTYLHDDILDSTSRYLNTLRFPVKRTGYTYAVSAIAKMVEGANFRKVTELYELVAAEHGTTWKAVERGIRAAVDQMLERCDCENLRFYFDLDPSKPMRLTDATFLRMMAYFVRLNLEAKHEQRICLPGMWGIPGPR